MSYLPGKFVWFEHLSPDISKARRFYEVLFGWHTESMPMGARRYSMILNKQQGIGGYSDARAGEPARWLAYVSVPDVDAAHATALADGAKELMPPTAFGQIGRGSTIADPTGAELSLWKSAEGDRADPLRTAVGDWYWNELWTADEARAIRFYTRLLGYTDEPMDMGEHGIYHVLKRDGVARAGLSRSTQPQARSMWLPYVAVEDCDITAAQAATLGGEVVTPPTEIEGVGRFAVLVDTLGAAVAIMKPAPGAM